MIRETDQYFLNQEEPAKSCLLALRDIVLSQDPLVTETRKYGMPCYCYGKKAFCYLWTDKHTNEPYLLMVEGKHLNHPELEQGKRARMKIFRVNPIEDIPVDKINHILQDALDLYRKGTL